MEDSMRDELFPRWRLLNERAADISNVARSFGILDLAITGSVARGVDHASSDFDFWVLQRSDSQLDSATVQRELYAELQTLLGSSVDVRPLPQMVDDPSFQEGMRRDAIPLASLLDGSVAGPAVLAQPPRRVMVIRPRLEAERLAERVQGWVECWQDGRRIGRLSFGHKRDELLVRTTQFETDDAYQRQGVARVLARELVRSYPGCHVAFSGMKTTEAGDALFHSLRRHGVPIHAWDCSGTGPMCPCGVQTGTGATSDSSSTRRSGP